MEKPIPNKQFAVETDTQYSDNNDKFAKCLTGYSLLSVNLQCFFVWNCRNQAVILLVIL